MWAYMILCYVLSILTTLLLILTGLQGYYQFDVLGANHPTLAILSIVIYLFTEVATVFFFVSTGAGVKEFVQAHPGNDDYYAQTKTIKRRLFPAMMGNIFMVMLNFIFGGAVHTGHIPAWVHGLMFIVIVPHFIYVLKKQHEAFRVNAFLMLDLSKTADASAPGART